MLHYGNFIRSKTKDKDMARILLAEDDPSMLNFLKVALKRAGHSVVAHTNGQEAFNSLDQNIPENRKNKVPFDLLLTDIVMPGIDGLELAHKTTEKYPDIKVMFITGFAAMALESPNTAQKPRPQILSKPFHLNDLIGKLDTLLSQAQ